MRSISRTIALAATAAAVVGPVALAGPAAAAERVTACGTVVTGDAVLTNDLTCTTGDGVVLLPGASLDLRGHRLTGHADGRGVVVPVDGDVSVRRGTVDGWGTGVAVAASEEGSGGTTAVDRIRLRDNGTGIDGSSSAWWAGGVTFTITSSHVEHNGTGLSAVLASFFDVATSVLADNGTAAHMNSSGIRVVDSRVVRNGTALFCDESFCEIERTVVRDNGTGVDTRAFGATVRDSTLVGNTVAVASFTSWGPVELTGNTFRDNGTAVQLSWSSSTVVGNTFVRNGVGYVADGDDPFFTNHLEANTFTRNGDGILAVHGGTTVQDNSAVRNTRWGIHAPGAVDGGGNTAWRNGTEPQCVGVVCAPRS
ncbi:NosD domain-containing protein [Actinotalea sp. AC32]|nr:NosD domain-containing protein [Actinotalea sp. AC32]